MKIIAILFLVTLSTFSVSAKAVWESPNDPNDAVDNDSDAANLENILRQDPYYRPLPLFPNSGLRHDVTAPQVFYSFEKISGSLSEGLEKSFDAFIFINTANRDDGNPIVPAQHMRVIAKQRSGDVIFTRGFNNQITGVDAGLLKDALPKFEEMLPISSGKGAGYGIKTFSGIFRIDLKHSDDRLKTSPEADMSWQSYIDFYYPDGRHSGVAIHGTPSKFRSLLGKQPASHGCARTFPEIAKGIYKFIRSKDLLSNDVLLLDTTKQLPEPVRGSDGKLKTKPGTKTLMIIFNGTNGSSA
jgi:hypothetical protein